MMYCLWNEPTRRKRVVTFWPDQLTNQETNLSSTWSGRTNQWTNLSSTWPGRTNQRTNLSSLCIGRIKLMILYYGKNSNQIKYIWVGQHGARGNAILIPTVAVQGSTPAMLNMVLWLRVFKNISIQDSSFKIVFLCILFYFWIPLL
jgi:hypothetical protein